MCGIVAAISYRNVSDFLIDGLKKLEYRGYDSAGIAIVNDSKLQIQKSVGKVSCLETKLKESMIFGNLGIAHTRWATHGKPSEVNAHPHISSNIAIVHNGIIENYQELKDKLITQGYVFVSQTDTEVFAHLIHSKYVKGLTLLEAVNEARKEVVGAYGAAIINVDEPNHFIALRKGSPIVIGFGTHANYLASDALALMSQTNKFIYMLDDDIADISSEKVDIYDKDFKLVTRTIKEETSLSDFDSSLGNYQHYMQKEIYEQPLVIEKTLEGRIIQDKVVVESFGINADEIFKKVENIKIVACGTSYHAGLVAKYWIEKFLNIPIDVEIASEFRYRKSVTPKNSLFVTISQSGETADTLAALQLSKTLGYANSLAICNVQSSSLVRESDLVFLTRAGREIGVASTKAFITQLVSFLILTCAIGKSKGTIDQNIESSIVKSLKGLVNNSKLVLSLDKEIKQLAKDFINKTNCLFLGRGELTPIAMEGALKLKEISYIHAEAYAAGELKHGPLALVDENMPIVVVAPNDALIEKLISNIQEVSARGGLLYIFTNKDTTYTSGSNFRIIELPFENDENVNAILFTIPLQLLSYHTALIKGTDVDKPRNLAKSVTVE